jgi:hypothetical protein
VRLYGADYEALRYGAYQRARGDGVTAFCECGCGKFALWGSRLGITAKGEVSHLEHGSRKSDELTRVQWLRHECHMRRHQPKAVPKKEQ